MKRADFESRFNLSLDENLLLKIQWLAFITLSFEAVKIINRY